MAKLYIANCTKYVQDFLFRIPENPQLYQKVIPIGSQALIYKDAPLDVLEHIVDQHMQYGIVPLNEIDRTKGFFGLCYSFDKPIDVERIMSAVAHNEEELVKKGYEQRKQAAAALSNVIDNNMDGSKSKLQGMEMEVVEQPKIGDNGPKMSETIQVAKPGSKAAARGAQRAAESR